MNAAYRTTCFAVCLALAACGNKGDLYLEEIELSPEQKAVLNNNGTEKDVDKDTRKTKKKKTDTTEINTQ